MKYSKVFAFAIALLMLLGACGPKPAYKTSKGKKKLKYYNSIQFQGKPHNQKPA